MDPQKLTELYFIYRYEYDMLEQKKMKLVKEIEVSQRRLLEDMLLQATTKTTTKKQLKSVIDKSSKVAEPKKKPSTTETSPFTEEEMLYISINCETHTPKEILDVFPRLKPMKTHVEKVLTAMKSLGRIKTYQTIPNDVLAREKENEKKRKATEAKSKKGSTKKTKK